MQHAPHCRSPQPLVPLLPHGGHCNGTIAIAHRKTLRGANGPCRAAPPRRCLRKKVEQAQKQEAAYLRHCYSSRPLPLRPSLGAFTDNEMMSEPSIETCQWEIPGQRLRLCPTVQKNFCVPFAAWILIYLIFFKIHNCFNLNGIMHPD